MFFSPENHRKTTQLYLFGLINRSLPLTLPFGTHLIQIHLSRCLSFKISRQRSQILAKCTHLKIVHSGEFFG